MTAPGRLPAALLVLVTIAFAISPAFTPNFGGYDPDQFPLRVERPAILPAGYAFSIWGPIYLWLALHALFGLWKRPDDPVWSAVRLPLIGSVAVGAVWLAVAVRSPVMASLLIALMLALALAALVRAPKRPDRWLLLAPVAVYAGWLTAATGVSVGVLMTGYGWLDNTAAAVVMLCAVLLVAATVQRQIGRAPEYAATVNWALAAVIVANAEANLVVTLVAAAGILVMTWAAWRSVG
jgi:hypothetical protein